LALGEHVIPIPGCSRPASIADSARAPELELASEQLARLSASRPATSARR
jgi:diketogulonate reductase-like aldo/keto reductase